jgi:hypothetical protein
LRNQGKRSKQKDGEERAEASDSPTREKTSMIIVWTGRRIKDFHFAFPSEIKDISVLDVMYERGFALRG